MNFPFSTTSKDGFEDITRVDLEDQDDKKQPLFDAADVNEAQAYGANTVPIIEDVNTQQGTNSTTADSSPPSSPRFNDPTVRLSATSNSDPTLLSSDFSKYLGVAGRPKGHSFAIIGPDMRRAVLCVNIVGLASVCLGLDPCFPRIIMNTVLDPFYYFERPDDGSDEGDDYVESKAVDENYNEAFMSRAMYTGMLVLFALFCVGSYSAGIYGALYWKPRHVAWATIYYLTVLFVCIIASSKAGILLSMVCLYPHLVWLFQFRYGDGFWQEKNYTAPEQHWWNMSWLV